jgi:hypothetical protein
MDAAISPLATLKRVAVMFAEHDRWYEATLEDSDQGRTREATRSVNPLFADEMIECVREARSPTSEELFRLAERIWKESSAERSAFAWGDLPLSNPERQCALRAAAIAAAGARDE